MKDYKKILEGVVNIINTTERSDIGFDNICAYIGENCPELKEDEDERMWKLIKKYANFNISDTALNADHITRKQLKSWLEKQSEQKSDDNVEPRFKVGDWIVSDTSNSVYRVDSILFPQSKCYCLSYNGGTVLLNFASEQNYRLWTIDDAEDGNVLVTVGDEYPFIYRGRLDPVHPNSPVAYCGIDTEGYFCVGGDKHYHWWTDAEVHPATKEQRDLLFQKMKEAGYEWDVEKKELKKIEPKSADKVEPKFYEDDWIVDNEEGDFFKVIRVRDNTYRIVSQEGEEFDIQKSVAESYYHRFTVNDAKDGDVLISEDDCPFIYAGHNIYIEFLTAYCGIANDGEFKISDKTELWTNDNVEPATKEQRDILFKAMADAGYTFDFEKKELRKIERKPAWSVSHVRTWLYIVSDVLTKHDGIGQYLDDGFCKKIAKYMQENWSKKLSLEQNSAWSEEDERMLVDCFNILHRSDYSIDKISKTVNWLKSLKDRIGG